MNYTITCTRVLIVELFMGLCIAVMSVGNMLSMFDEMIIAQLYIATVVITALFTATAWWFEWAFENVDIIDEEQKI